MTKNWRLTLSSFFWTKHTVLEKEIEHPLAVIAQLRGYRSKLYASRITRQYAQWRAAGRCYTCIKRADVGEGMTHRSVSPPYEYVTTEGHLTAIIERIAPSSVVAIALGTTGPDTFVDRIRTLQLAVPDHAPAVVDCAQVPQEGLAKLQDLFEIPAVKVMHNGKLALKFLCQAGFDLSSPYFDTMLASQLLKGGLEARHDLKTVAKAYLDEHMPETCGNFRAIALTERQLRCAGQTVGVVLGLHATLSERIESAGLTDCMRLECNCLPAVAAMERNGMLMDMEQWRTLQDTYNELEEDLAYEVCRELTTSGQRTLGDVAALNLGSPHQVKRALRSAGVPVRNVREDELLKFEEAHPVIPHYIRYKHVLKLKNGFLDALPRHVHPLTGRIHPTFLQVGTVNGRFACRNPNLQQIPRDGTVRGCFVAARDHRLVIADYAQFELRVVADISGDETMTRAFQRGEDLHRLTASLVLDTPLDQVTKDERIVAKVLNIGLIYGMGARSLRRYANYNYGVHLTLEDAYEFRRRFFDAYSGVRAFHRSMSTTPLISIRTLSGRIRRWADGQDPKLTELLNTRVQGTAADIMKRAVTSLHEALGPTRAKIVCCVHDELLVETPKVRAAEVAEAVAYHMRAAGNEFLRNVPLDVDVAIARSWAGKG
ncbi:MAG: DNA polymerase [Euryarchaeota archaeon]